MHWTQVSQTLHGGKKALQQGWSRIRVQRWWLTCAQCQIAFLPRLQIVNAIQNARKLCGAKPFNEAFKSFGIKGGDLLALSQ